MDYKKMDTITNKLSYIAAFISSITSIVSIALVLTGKIEEWMKTPFYQVVFLMLSVALVFCTFYFIKNIKKYKTIRGQLEAQNNILTEDVNLLRENICFGLEYLANDVNIEFIKGKKAEDNKYKLTFHKKCRAIGECKWYSGQVYFNNQLQDEKASEKFYFENQISWVDLNATARIRTYSLDGASKDHDADIYAVAKSPRYFQFHIRFGTSEGRINPAEYESFEIIYSYEVPITHWGSYINRTISYFGEPTKVNFNLNLEAIDIKKAKSQETFVKRFMDEILVFEKKPDQDPTLLSSDTFSCKREGANSDCVVIELPKTRAKKYIVSWNPQSYFGKDCQKTEIKRDSAELTAQ